MLPFLCERVVAHELRGAVAHISTAPTEADLSSHRRGSRIVGEHEGIGRDHYSGVRSTPRFAREFVQVMLREPAEPKTSRACGARRIVDGEPSYGKGRRYPVDSV